jgi:hypothetical protein
MSIDYPSDRPKVGSAWLYLTVTSTLDQINPDWMGSNYWLAVEGRAEQRFRTPDEAMAALGAEGWECIHFHQDDGPRQQIVPGSLVQAPKFPPRYTLRFKRRAG